jgi:membrane associated rhomboid family serine protease
MAYGVNDEQDYPRMTPVVKALIAINVAIAFLQITIVDPSQTMQALGFSYSDFKSNSWWSLLTHMFVHGGAMHLILNMYMLFVFGPRLEYSWGQGSFTRFYLWCGLGGLLVHLALSQNNGVLIGASGAIMGVMYGYAASWPDEEVLFFGVIPMKVKTLVALFIAINLLGGIVSVGASGGVAYFAHLGGIVFAMAYLHRPSLGGLDRLKNRISPVPDESDEPPRAVPRSLPRSREKMSEIDEIVARSNAAATRRSATAPPRKATQQGGSSAALDLVLDKISERGLESLTPAERKLLEDMSRELRGRR